MSQWFKMDPQAWNDGTNSLTLEQEAAYLRICNAIYISGRPIDNNQFVLAGLLRCNDRKAKRILEELVAAGKVTVRDGKIENRRALEEVSNRDRLITERKSAGSRGGIESAKSRANILKNNNADQAIASTENEPDKIREDKKEKEEPNGSSKKRASRLSSDWSLPDEWRQVATGMGFPPSRIDAEAERMRDWSISSKNGAKLDWLATWRNWIRGKLEDNPSWAVSPEACTSSDLVTLPADHPDVKAVERMNGKPIVVGQRGTVTLRKTDVERARERVE